MDLCAVAEEATRRKIPPEQVVQERRERQWTRRAFLVHAAKLGAVASGMAALPGCLSVTPTNSGTQIIIVGAGLAGLTCAFRLKQAGYRATVLDAAGRLGGRCLSRRGHFDDGQIAERGGELIDTSHKAIRRLTRQLGLRLEDVQAAQRPGTIPLYYFQGEPYTMAEARADFVKMYPTLQDDLAAADYPTLHNRYTERGKELDGQSITDWISRKVPGGLESKLGQLLTVAYTTEYGLDAREQSALNLLYLFGYSANNKLELYGRSDERFRLRGGNDQLVTRLAENLEGQIELRSALVALARKSDGRWALTMESPGGTHVVTADHVVLALPFSVLRSSVDLSRAGFGPLKHAVIQEQGMATNTKLHLQFADRHWRTLGFDGNTLADTGYQCSWDSSRAQPGACGLLASFTGGEIGARLNCGTIKDHATKLLRQIEPLFPGLTAKWNGQATLDYWTGNRWILGSYSCWKVGQYTRLAGAAGTREGYCHFAGEHTSLESQGYLNGAVETGERAAQEIVADFGRKS
jgi:monoamine oxidase